MTHAEEVARLRTNLLQSAGATVRMLREAALRGADVPDPWTKYVEKVRQASYRITDQDVEDVLAASRSEDAVFEMTLAAAVGAGTDRLEAG